MRPTALAEVVGQEHLLGAGKVLRSEEHTSELQSRSDLVCRLLLEKKKKIEIVKIPDATPDVRAHKRQRQVVPAGTSRDIRAVADVSDIRHSLHVRHLGATLPHVTK